MSVTTYRLRGLVDGDLVGDLVMSVALCGPIATRFEPWSEYRPSRPRYRIARWRPGVFEIREGQQYAFPHMDNIPEEVQFRDWFYTFHNNWGWIRRDDPRVSAMEQRQRDAYL